jgi:hypothetical protein
VSASADIVWLRDDFRLDDQAFIHVVGPKSPAAVASASIEMLRFMEISSLGDEWRARDSCCETRCGGLRRSEASHAAARLDYLSGDSGLGHLVHLTGAMAPAALTLPALFIWLCYRQFRLPHSRMSLPFLIKSLEPAVQRNPL